VNSGKVERKHAERHQEGEGVVRKDAEECLPARLTAGRTIVNGISNLAHKGAWEK